MKKQTPGPQIINSISELHRLSSLPKPEHPLVSLINYDDIKNNTTGVSKIFLLNFYMVCIKKNYKGKLRYGQNYYDFDEGVLSFMSPGQVITESNEAGDPLSGWC